MWQTAKKTKPYIKNIINELWTFKVSNKAHYVGIIVPWDDAKASESANIDF